MRSVLLIAGVVAFGATGYALIEGWTPWRSLFFTLVTLTTVGYTDYGLSEAGERFTALLLVGGIGAVSYTGGQILQRAVVQATRPERRIMQQIKHMQDHYVVCGLGRTGQRVVDKLRDGGVDVVAIDTSEREVEEARSRGVCAIVGDATSDAAMERVGIERAAAVAAVTSSDAINALICLTSRALAPEATLIARAEEESSICKLKRAGATSVIAPATYGADGVAEDMMRPEVARLMPGVHGSDGDLQFAEVMVSACSPYRGLTLERLAAEHPSLAFVAARGHDGRLTVRPDPTHRLNQGDVLVVAGVAVDVKRIDWRRRAA